MQSVITLSVIAPVETLSLEIEDVNQSHFSEKFPKLFLKLVFLYFFEKHYLSLEPL
jgi:hypothetical protein